MHRPSRSFAATPGLMDAAASPGDQLLSLQRYLHDFGYLNLEGEEPVEEATPANLLPRAKPRVLDSATKDALRHFQRFNGLPESGTLDAATVRRINFPRCGVPDRQMYGERVAREAVAANSWGKTDLAYSFNNFSTKLSRIEVQGAFLAAFALWSQVTPLSFQPVNGSGDITIQFFPPDEPGYPFDGPFGILAVTYFPTDGRSQFDDAETWTYNFPEVPGVDQGIDLISVAAHELGHALGLYHSQDTNALMYASYTGPHRFLAADDITQIQQLYGPRTGPLAAGMEATTPRSRRGRTPRA